MKKVIVLVLMLATALAWLYFAWPTDSKKTSINQITFQLNGQDNLPKTPKENARENNLAVEMLIKTQNPTSNNQPNSLTERTFMAIYRDIKLAEDCDNFYQQHHQTLGKYDYLQVLHKARQYQNGQQAPPVQVQALETWVQKCLNLKSAVFFRASIDAEFPDYKYAYPVLVELRKEWHSTQPETPAEKHLAKVTQLSEQWAQALNKLLQVTKGDYFHNNAERLSLTESEYQIQQQLGDLYLRTDQVSLTAIEELNQQQAALRAQSNQRLPVDEAQRLAALDAFNQLTYYMEQAMYDGFPASFVALVETLEMTDQFHFKVASADYHPYSTSVIKLIPEYTPPSMHLFAYAKTQDQHVFNLLVEPASQLLLCYLGADCGSESEWVRHYCLGNDYNETTFPSACGKSLLDFYTEDYLTPNLWLDVSELFDKMVAYYES